MKFLCDNCKAKYQIADEKVAGKTVRMKCRKCGHQIEVRAAVTETSVATQPPPRPGGPAKSPLATSLSSAQKPRAPQAQPASQGSGALAGAFQRTVQEAPAPVPTPGIEISVTNEWYVAINGVPVGPVRISELRRKAAAGAVTEDSLCWQEGLEEWRPIRSIPDLAALVREAAQGNRPSLLGTPPPAPTASAAPRAPQAPQTPSPARSLAPKPEPARPAPPQRSNVVPLHPDRAPVASPVGGAAAALAPSFAPSQAPSPAPTPAPAPAAVAQTSLAPAPVAAPSAVPDPFAVPPPAATPAPNPLAPAAAASPSIAPPAPAYLPVDSGRRNVPLWFWPVLVLALGFGGGLAFLLFRQPAQPPPVVIQMPATAVPTEPKVDVPPPTTEPVPSASAAPATTGGGSKPVAVAARSTPAPAATPNEKRTADLSGLLGGAGGPSGGPGAGGPSGGSGGGLDSAAVERVVGAHRAGVKRQCWERVSSDKGNVAVTVTATVAPDGSVSSTSSSGDDPVVGKCIENQVRTWRFPAPGSTTTVNIPFKFFRQ